MLFLAVRRDPEALAAGQVWRLVSPVLVQPDPLPSVIGLAALAAVVGTIAERTLGTGRLAVLLAAGALAGHGVGEWWQPYSGGVSVAFCGPLGALAVYALIERSRPVPAAVVLVGAVVLSVITDIHGPAIPGRRGRRVPRRAAGQAQPTDCHPAGKQSLNPCSRVRD
ncbi:rhomboid family intramembrane serine protease [Amycolatopsis sp. NPDC059657]|uniref:rhomboid family intramembrane serine protease n=1 Tax=Amycolatopsis sp. NPDC059657 TaxID=3346899 RepID=UPI0036729C75